MPAEKGTKIDLKMKPSRLMPEKQETLIYPSLYVTDLDGKSPLLDYKVGEEFEATVKLRVDGLHRQSIDLAVKSLTF